MQGPDCRVPRISRRVVFPALAVGKPKKRMAPQVGLEPTTLRLTADPYTRRALILKGVTAAQNRPNRPSLGVLLDNLLDKFRSTTHSRPGITPPSGMHPPQVYVNSSCVKRENQNQQHRRCCLQTSSFFPFVRHLRLSAQHIFTPRRSATAGTTPRPLVVAKVLPGVVSAGR